MTTVYLCIGMQKTGTTSLQSFMRNNEKALDRQGYCYPLMNVKFPEPYYADRNAHFLVHQTESAEIVKEKKEKGYLFLETLARQYKNIVLSDEILWYRCNQIENFWEDVVENFRKINCEVKVVAYLRRQDELIHSLWNQRVKGKGGITENFKNFLFNKGFSFSEAENGESGVCASYTERDSKVAYFPLNYYENLKKIEGHVGRENLYVRIFEPGQFEGEKHTLLSDYLKTLGISYSDDFIVEDEIKNDGLTNNFVEIKRIMNGVKEYKTMKNFLRGPLMAANKCQMENYPDEKSSVFSYEERVAFLKLFEEDNRKTAQDYFGRSDGILFRKPVPNLPQWTADSNTMYRDIMAYATEVFCMQEKQLTQLREEVAVLKRDVRAIQESIIFRIYRKLRKIFKKG